MPGHYYIFVSLALFFIGTAGALLRRNALFVLMSLELQLSAGSLALLTFARGLGDQKGPRGRVLRHGLGRRRGCGGTGYCRFGLSCAQEDRPRRHQRAAELIMFSRLHMIPLLPLLGAAYLILFGRRHSRSVVQTLASLAVFASFVVSADAFFFGLPALVHEGGITELVYEWFSAGSVTVDLSLRMDALSGLLCLVVTFIGTLIHVYSAGYMAHDEDYPRFFAYLNLFCGAMLMWCWATACP
jgi:hypothetical protein